jgi:hypothetical protein
LAWTVPAQRGTGALHFLAGDPRPAHLCATLRDQACLAFFLVAYIKYYP